MRSLERIVTHDEADWEILKLANEKGKFALELALNIGADRQEALERGMDNDWWAFIDVTPLANAPARLMRVFKLTPVGWVRRNDLALVFDVEEDES